MRHEPEQWKTDYERDGYVVVEDVLSADDLAALREGIETITRDPSALPEHLRRHCHLEAEYARSRPDMNANSPEVIGNAVRNIMELPLFDRRFARLIAHAPLLDVLEALFESREFHFHNYKCIIKAPKVSSQFQWHRDLPYLEHSTPNLITAMLCLDPMTPENGATVVYPGSHRIPHEAVKPGDIDIAPEDLPDAPAVTVTCPAGAAVLFHVNIVHGGPPNVSDAPRRNIIGIWAGPDTYPVTAARYAFQGLFPRSVDPGRQRQMQLTFPEFHGMAASQVLDFAVSGDPQGLRETQQRAG